MNIKPTLHLYPYNFQGIHLGKIANGDGLEIEGAFGGRSRR
ncbi:hypothetical protein LINGRAHAP2_LOCUS7681 [Linum grandiflorum]